MEKPGFCYPNWTLPTSVVTPAITGTGWVDLSKLQGDVLSEMARYPGVTPADTKITIDLGTTRNIDVLALPFHNAKIGDTAQIEIATDSGFTDIVLDTGALEFFGEVYPYGTLMWGRVEWMDGRLTEEQAANSTPPWIYMTSDTVYGRYVRISLDFSGNADGYVDIGQPVIAQLLRPTYNFSYGASPPFYRDPSPRSRVKSGPVFKDEQRKYRATRFVLEHMSEDELYGQFYEMVRENGVTKPFFFIYNIDASAALLPKQSFMATAERIDDPTNPDVGMHSMPVEIAEEF